MLRAQSSERSCNRQPALDLASHGGADALRIQDCNTAGGALTADSTSCKLAAALCSVAAFLCAGQPAKPTDWAVWRVPFLVVGLHGTGWNSTSANDSMGLYARAGQPAVYQATARWCRMHDATWRA